MLTNQPKTIQIFLPDGNPRSIKIAEITSRTVQATLIPRSKIDEAIKRKELSGVGTYFLFGDDDESAKPLIYIGESEDCLARLKQHNREKDFWQHAIIITSKTQYFTKSHIKFLESHSAEIALKINRYAINNNTVPIKPHISESAEADLQDNFDTIKLLVSALGYSVFDEYAQANDDEILFCKSKFAKAKGKYSDGSLVVLQGSICNQISSSTLLAAGNPESATSSTSNWVVSTRDKLIKSGIIEMINDQYEFISDHEFSSPSGAAVAVLGRRANGWKEWKYSDGRTLDEVHRQ